MTLARVRIEKLVAGGAGLARTPSGVVLVTGALPDELVEVELHKKRGTLEGKLRRIIEPTAARVHVRRGTPPTANLAHAEYSAQLGYKHAIVQEALERIGKQDFAVAATQPSPLEWNYRNAAQYLVTPAGIGYRQPNTHRAWLLESDPLVGNVLSDGLAALDGEKLAPSLEIALRGSFLTGEVLACLIGKDSPNRFRNAVKHLRNLGVGGISYAFASLEGRFRAGTEQLFGEQTILEQYGDFALSVSASGFAQVNPQAASQLYKKARELAGHGNLAVDVYGGSGALGLHFAKHFKSVQVIEINAEAIARGQADQKRLGIQNCSFTRGDAARLERVFADCIALDPPRAGLSQDVVRSVLLARAPRLLYISCEPTTWARDVAKLTRGGYRLTYAQPWDFYPQTSHVEVLSLLEL